MKLKIHFALIGSALIMHVWMNMHTTSALFAFQEVWFPFIRTIFDNTWGRLDIPFVYALFVLMITSLFWYFYRKKNKDKVSTTYVHKLKNLAIWTLSVLSLFFWLWGFHYYQKDMMDRVELEEKTLDSLYLANETEKVVHLLNEYRKNLKTDSLNVFSDRDFLDVEKSIRPKVEDVVSQFDWKVYGRVRVRNVKPKGILLRFSTAGIYFPYVFEGHVDAGLHPLQKPFTLAHEMAHGYGVTDEGDCNLVALLVTLQSDNAEVQYSGLLTYFRYLYNDDRFKNHEIIDFLNDEVKSDLQKIRENSKKYPDLFPFFRDYIYDWYLKILGVEQGLKSYFSLIDHFYQLKELHPEWVPQFTKTDL